MGSALSVVVVATADSTRPALVDPFTAVCGRPLVSYAIDAFAGLEVDRIVVVVGRGTLDDTGAKRLNDAFATRSVECVEQRVARGSGDAVAVALTALADDLGDLDEAASVAVVPARAALLRRRSVAELISAHDATDHAVTLLTTAATDGRGDVVRGRDDRLLGLEADIASPEASTGVAVFRRSLLRAALRRVVPRYSFGESDLDDVVAVLTDAGHGAGAVALPDSAEAVLAADNRTLARIETELRRRINAHWLAHGVTMVDPDRTYIDATVTLGEGTHLLPGCILAGQCSVGAAAVLGPDVHLTDCAIGRGAVIRSSSGLDAEVGPGAVVGPYAVLMPGAQIGADAVTGPFYAAPSSAD